MYAVLMTTEWRCQDSFRARIAQEQNHTIILGNAKKCVSAHKNKQTNKNKQTKTNKQNRSMRGQGLYFLDSNGD